MLLIGWLLLDHITRYGLQWALAVLLLLSRRWLNIWRAALRRSLGEEQQAIVIDCREDLAALLLGAWLLALLLHSILLIKYLGKPLKELLLLPWGHDTLWLSTDLRIKLFFKWLKINFEVRIGHKLLLHRWTRLWKIRHNGVLYLKWPVLQGISNDLFIILIKVLTLLLMVHLLPLFDDLFQWLHQQLPHFRLLQVNDLNCRGTQHYLISLLYFFLFHTAGAGAYIVHRGGELFGLVKLGDP